MLESSHDPKKECESCISKIVLFPAHTSNLRVHHGKVSKCDQNVINKISEFQKLGLQPSKSYN